MPLCADDGIAEISQRVNDGLDDRGRSRNRSRPRSTAAPVMFFIPEYSFEPRAKDETSHGS